MKNYLITVIAKIESENVCKDLALAITPIVDSPNLKFQHSNGLLLFYFSSDVSKEEVFDYVRTVLFGVTESFILTEVNDNLTVSLPDEFKNHLMDLEKEGENLQMRIDMKDAKTNNNFSKYSEEDEDEFVALLLDELKQNIKKPTLDSILDKMLDGGFDCLSQKEKDTLEYYSKNY